MRNLLIAFSLLILANISAFAQFNSGSTGADGALDLTSCASPCYIQLPESGILNYTTVDIPAGKVLRFKRNLRNTPVIMLAQGNVTISGTIDVSSPCVGIFGADPGCLSGREGGPGGFSGGAAGRPGFGPGGGGYPTCGHGSWVGPLSLVPIIGGSGGSGCSNGGGGGGAIVIASSTTITMSGQIAAYGWLNNYYGSGGAIRLVGNSITASGSFNAVAYPAGIAGVVRLESQPGQMTFTGSANPPATLAPVNPDIISSNQPQLTLVSVGGYAVPAYAGTRFDTIDILLPNSIPDPISVVVQAANIPVGTQVDVGFVNGSPGGTSTPCNLAGTLASSSCTATISNMNRTQVTYLIATAAFDPPARMGKYNPKGTNHVAKVKMESVLGKQTKYLFIDKKGKEIAQNKLKREFLAFFGM